MSGHTPEWFAQGTHVYAWEGSPGLSEPSFVADCDSEEVARLTAAAPELRDACWAALTSLMDPNAGQAETLRLLRSAIAKAGGQS